MASKRVIKAIVWACISSWYYGYHISELNYAVKSLACFASPDDASKLFPPCIGIDDKKYSIVTSLLTAGGLAGSMFSDRLVRAEGISGAIAWTGWLNLAASALMAAAPHWLILALGRVVAGVVCGLAVCLVPPYLASIARTTPELANKSGQVGTLHQLALVLGICSGQIIGAIFTGSQGNKPGGWRWICAASGVLSIIQIITVEDIPLKYDAVSTSDEENPEDREDREATGPLSPSLPESGAPLLRPKPTNDQLTTRDLLSTPALRGPALLVTAMLCFQQLSGVNAVLFYSSAVLEAIFPNAGAGALSIGITVVNALMTFPAIFLVDRVGRRSLLLVSSIGMGIMSLLLGYGLNHHKKYLSGWSIVCFIATFAIGLGPVPFLLVSDMVPPHAVPALSSLALAASWITTFLVAALFLPLREWLLIHVDPSDPKSPVAGGEGTVFYIFTGMLALTAIVTFRGVPK